MASMSAPLRVSKRAAAIQAVGKIKASLDHLNHWDAAGNEIKICKSPVESSHNPHGEIQTGKKRQRDTHSLPSDSDDDSDDDSASKHSVATSTPSKGLMPSDGSNIIHHMSLFEVCNREEEIARFSSSCSSYSDRSMTLRPISLTEMRGYEDHADRSSLGNSSSDDLFSSDDRFSSSDVSCPTDSIEYQRMSMALFKNEANQEHATRLEKTELRRHHSDRDMFLSKRLSRNIHAKSLSPALSPLEATCLPFSPEIVAQIKPASNSRNVNQQKQVGQL